MYLKRLTDSELVDRLERVGAVLIEGPKACGKTSTGRHHAASEILLDTAISSFPIPLILKGEHPRLIDEWQVIPEIWNQVRHMVDYTNGKGLYILTGSARPADDATRHTGAGRFARLRMRTMSLVESGHSEGLVSLARLRHNEPIEPQPGSNSLDAVIDAVMRGGWPMNIGSSRSNASLAVREYVREVIRGDVAFVAQRERRRDVRKVQAVLMSIARSVGSALSASTIANDCAGDGSRMSDDTVRAYLDALDDVMLIERLPAWAPHIRSRAALRSQRKIYLADPSLALALLGVSEKRLVQEPAFFGIVFENLVMRDLFVYAQHSDARVSYYRDSNGLEADAIIEHADGGWSAIEIKLSHRAVDDAAATLHRLASTIDTQKQGTPRSLIVITGEGPAYTRTDGVHVVPITMLGA